MTHRRNVWLRKGCLDCVGSFLVGWSLPRSPKVLQWPYFTAELQVVEAPSCLLTNSQSRQRVLGRGKVWSELLRLLRPSQLGQSNSQIIIRDPALRVLGEGVSPEGFEIVIGVRLPPGSRSQQQQDDCACQSSQLATSRAGLLENRCAGANCQSDQPDASQVLKMVGNKRVAEGITLSFPSTKVL